MISSLAYLGFRSPARDDWLSFGPDVLGAQVVGAGADGPVALRFDEHAARLMIHHGERDELAYIGWDCGDADGLADTVERVRVAGIDVAGPDDADSVERAGARNVAALASFSDPFGFHHEVTHGLATVGEFTPGRPMNGRFVTGEGGLGHIVVIVPDLDAAMDFFVGTLGFLESDHIEIGGERGMKLRFLHCNPRHHTLALSAAPGLAGFHHLMVEVGELDDVGAALDVVNEREMTLAMTLGRHTNDLMTSFYVRTPSGFEIEYGTGGVLIDDADWEVSTHDAMSLWGHKPPGKPLRPGIMRKVEVEVEVEVEFDVDAAPAATPAGG